MGRISVLLAEDDEVIREALADLLADEGRIELVGVAWDADEAIALATAFKPDVAVLDVRMPKGGGLVAAKAIKQESPQTRLIALSAYEDNPTMDEMREAGAEEYLVKGEPPGRIIELILAGSNHVDGP